MEKDQKILISLITITFIVAVVIGVYFLIIKKDTSPDAVKFKKKYESYNDKTIENNKDKYLKVDLDNENVYVYKTDEEIIDIINNETGVVYFGFAECPYCRSMVKILNDVAKDNKIDKIYYVDIENIRDSYEIINKTIAKITNGTSSYYKLLDILGDYLSDYIILDDDGQEYNTGVKRLYAPTVVAVKNGQIIGFHEGTLEDATYNKKLTEEETKELKTIYNDLLKQLSNEKCNKKSC